MNLDTIEYQVGPLQVRRSAGGRYLLDTSYEDVFWGGRRIATQYRRSGTSQAWLESKVRERLQAAEEYVGKLRKQLATETTNLENWHRYQQILKASQK